MRPTTRKVLEALMQILEHAVGALEGCAVLEVCAGTGQLGRAALERSCPRAAFIERDSAVAADLRARLQEMATQGVGCGRTQVVTGSAPAALSRVEGPFDIIFVDPPYSTDIAHRSLEAIARLGLLTSRGVVAVEHHHKDDVPPVVLDLERHRLERYGETAMSFFRRAQPLVAQSVASALS